MNIFRTFIMAVALALIAFSYSDNQHHLVAAAVPAIPDNTPIILSAINSGKTLPTGVLTLTRTLVLTNRTGIVIAGNGTTLKWAGPADTPMIQLNGVAKSCLRDLTIDAGNASIAVLTTSTAEYGAGLNKFDNVHIIGAGIGYQMGISAAEINCSECEWSGCTFQNNSICLKVINTQGVCYHFQGTTAWGVGKVFDFVRGGCLTVDGLAVAGGYGSTVLHIGENGGQENDIFFNLRGVRVEDGTLVDTEAIGGCIVNLDGCQQAGGNADRSQYVAAIRAAGRGRVSARDCQFFGQVVTSGPDMRVKLKECYLLGERQIGEGVVAEECKGIFNYNPIPAVKRNP